MTSQVIFLKLGGSLITNKDKPYTVEVSTLIRISTEIHQFLQDHPQTRLIIGHGSGSFGHTSASKFHTRDGVSSPEEWLGFQQVCFDARSLNQIVLQTLHKSSVPAIAFPPSTQIISRDHEIQSWNIAGIRKALDHGLVPLIFGDTVFDESIGGTILSTEDLFTYLAPWILPEKILLAGIEDGVWADYPLRREKITKLTPATSPAYERQILGSGSIDVTGGMTTKIKSMLALIESIPGLTCQIFSGQLTGSVYSALAGKEIGTIISQT